jgi:hypothetical protein
MFLAGQIRNQCHANYVSITIYLIYNKYILIMKYSICRNFDLNLILKVMGKSISVEVLNGFLCLPAESRFYTSAFSAAKPS